MCIFDVHWEVKAILDSMFDLKTNPGRRCVMVDVKMKDFEMGRDWRVLVRHRNKGRNVKGIAVRHEGRHTTHLDDTIIMRKVLITVL